ncbi:MAG: phosphotransferase [Pirellulaceae bacterium]
MNEPLSGRPDLSASLAQQLAAEYFHVIGEPSVLPSERDQNFFIQSASDPGTAWVLKIANAFATEASLDFQNRLIIHLGKSLKTAVPKLINSVSGEPMVWIEISGRRHAMRLLSYLPGTPWAHIRYHSKQLGQSLGRFVGRLLSSLQTFRTRPEFARLNGTWRRVRRPSRSVWIRSLIPNNNNWSDIFCTITNPTFSTYTVACVAVPSIMTPMITTF